MHAPQYPAPISGNGHGLLMCWPHSTKCLWARRSLQSSSLHKQANNLMTTPRLPQPVPQDGGRTSLYPASPERAGARPSSSRA
jgi:hypothetical protein